MTDEQLKAIAAVYEQDIARLERERFYALCESHLDRAREKHPFFADSVGAKGAPNEWYEELALKRKCLIQSAPHLENVLIGEVYEFLAEMVRGDRDRAREEGADIVAVILRALEGDIKPEESE